MSARAELCSFNSIFSFRSSFPDERIDSFSLWRVESFSSRKNSLSSIESMGSASLPAQVCWLFCTVSSIVAWFEKEGLRKVQKGWKKKEEKKLKKLFGLVLRAVAMRRRGSRTGADEESVYWLERNTKKERNRCARTLSLDLTERCTGWWKDWRRR